MCAAKKITYIKYLLKELSAYFLTRAFKVHVYLSPWVLETAYYGYRVNKLLRELQMSMLANLIYDWL